MRDWEPGDLRLLAAYVVGDQGLGAGTDAEFGAYELDLAEQLAVRTVRQEADDSFPAHRPLTDEQVHRVRRHIYTAVIEVDGERWDPQG